MEIIPFYDHGKQALVDGDLIRAHDWCHKNYNSRCAKHYASIMDAVGFHTCPYGFTSCVREVGTTKVTYTSLRVRGHDDRKKSAPKVAPAETSRRVSEDEAQHLMDRSVAYNNSTFALEEKISYLEKRNGDLLEQSNERNRLVNATLHEIRTLNQTMQSQTEDIISANDKYIVHDDGDYFGYRVNNINATARLIATRIAAFDLLANPDVITMSREKNVPVHKRFFKSRQILHTYYRARNISFDFHGSSYSLATANDLFDLLPYVLYENCVKYAPPGSRIDTTFTEDASSIRIELSSMGPRLKPGEELRIFDRSYRGEYAKDSGVPGQGLGLYLARTVCEMFRIRISAFSAEPYEKRDGTHYGRFTLLLVIPISVKQFA